MMLHSTPKGVLNQNYANDRIKKNELHFRLKVRAKCACDAVCRHYHKTSGVQILDFGSAEGKTILEMNRLLPDSLICGIEYSKSLIEAAKKLPDNAFILQGDVCSIPKDIPENTFDIITALACLEHLSNPVDAVKEAFRVLKTQGLLIITCPVPFWDNMANKAGFLKEEHHESVMDKRKLLSVVKEGGFQLVEYKRFMFAPVSFLPYLNIPVSIDFSLAFDDMIQRFKILNLLFVNQVVVCKKL
jgi:SAM-dependent methyltransferase